MSTSKFRITLFSIRWSEEIITYNFPDCLPNPGDLIEIIDEDVYFVVYNRSFKSYQSSSDNLIPVTIHGEIKGHDENTPKNKFDAILKKLDYKLGNSNRKDIHLITSNDISL